MQLQIMNLLGGTISMSILQRFINKKQERNYSLIIVIICLAFFLGIFIGLTSRLVIIGG
jgi:TRAP-type C4-dicarboxylate transport system permease small subunit